MIRSYKYRLYPNKRQIEYLSRMLDAYRRLYNAALQERKEAWECRGVCIKYTHQANQLKKIRQDNPELARYSYSAAQQVLRRLDKAFKAFFRRVKNGEKPGYPRFKSQSRFKSVPFVFGDGATLKSQRLKIKGVGAIKVKWHRPIPGNATIKQVVVKRSNDGKWYAVFQIELPDPEPGLHPGSAVGIDLGLNSLIATSDGNIVESPRHFRRTEARLRRQQRRVSRRGKGSKRWRKAVQQIAKTHEKIANQRRDLHHKLSRWLVDNYSLIVFEDLNITGMAQSRFSKSILDAGWGQLIRFVSFKAEEAGSTVAVVDPHNTSQVCSRCGCLVKKNLSVRVHHCPHCGLVLDRDVNAARNILQRALTPPGRGGQALSVPVGALA